MLAQMSQQSTNTFHYLNKTTLFFKCVVLKGVVLSHCIRHALHELCHSKVVQGTKLPLIFNFWYLFFMLINYETFPSAFKMFRIQGVGLEMYVHFISRNLYFVLKIFFFHSLLLEICFKYFFTIIVYLKYVKHPQILFSHLQDRNMDVLLDFQYIQISR